METGQQTKLDAIADTLTSGSDAAFVFTYNEHEQIGPGFSSADIGVCTIKRIISYYYNSSELIITCKLTDDDLIYIKPIKKDGDMRKLGRF